MVIRPNRDESGPLTVDQALEQLRQSGRKGRDLHSALNKLAKGKVKQPALKAAILGAVMSQPGFGIRRLLAAYWCALMKNLDDPKEKAVSLLLA